MACEFLILASLADTTAITKVCGLAASFTKEADSWRVRSIISAGSPGILPATIPGKSIKSKLTHSEEYSSTMILSSVTPVISPFAALTKFSIH